MYDLPRVQDAAIAGKRVLIRVDFNVPLGVHNGVITVVDTARIKAAVPTIEYVHAQGASQIVLITHVGRPEGNVVEGLSVAPIREALKTFVDYPELELLENLRFDRREETNDDQFAQELASRADIYVNEAFSVSHRDDTSIVGVPKVLPSYAGLRFMEEVENLTAALTPPQGSLALIGGAKFETKQPLLEKLSSIYECVLLGGALANDLLKSRGMPVGMSRVSGLPVPTSLAENMHVCQPLDLVVTVDGNAREAETADVRQGERIVDIGQKTIEEWSKRLRESPFVLWNGPTGVYEEGFTAATDALAAAIAGSNNRAVIGGGDTLAALQKCTFDPSRIFISTAGGAMLEFLTHGTLPGIEALKQR